MGIRNGLLATVLVFLLLVVVVPDSVLGSRTRLLAEPEALVVSQSESTRDGAGSDSHSARKLTTEQRRRPIPEAAATGIHPPPVDDQVSKSVPSAPAVRQSRFALLFRSLAKGSPTPTPGTPSPGHN